MKKRLGTRGPRFVRYFAPLLEALTKLGGSGTPEDAKNTVAEDLGISEEELLETLESGQGRVSNSIDWARFYLSKAGYIDASKRGTWTLTQQGRAARLTEAAALDLFKKVHRKYKAGKKTAAARPQQRAQRKFEILPMPRKVARRIMVRCARGEKVMVVIAKNGKPTSTYGLDEYLSKRQLRLPAGNTQTRPSDALPRVKAGITMPLKREHYYE